MCDIIIIEDDLQLLRNMVLILQMEGYSTRAATDGASGLELVREKRPGLVLCDIMMPKMDGHSVLAAMNTDPLLADIPFIFVTALDERRDIRSGMSAGADDYLTKPFSSEELLAAVSSRLKRMDSIRQHSETLKFQKEHAILRKLVTPREMEILLMVGQGLTSREIADSAGIKLNTVEVHRANLMKKLEAPNAAILARWAVIAENMPVNNNPGE